MKKKLERCYPLGYDYRPEIIITALMCIFISAWSFFMYRAVLMFNLGPVTAGREDGVRIIVETAEYRVPAFIYGLEALQVFALVFIFALLTAVYRYFYHYQHSKSIYLMKRLPKRRELYKRCFMGCVIISAICLAVMLGLVAVCYAEYIREIPEEFRRIF